MWVTFQLDCAPFSIIKMFVLSAVSGSVHPMLELYLCSNLLSSLPPPLSVPPPLFPCLLSCFHTRPANTVSRHLTLSRIRGRTLSAFQCIVSKVSSWDVTCSDCVGAHNCIHQLQDCSYASAASAIYTLVLHCQAHLTQLAVRLISQGKSH